PERRYRHFSELAYDLDHPDSVEPFFQKGAPLLERDPLKFYRTGFWLLLAACIALLFRLLASH
ncbi:MAG: bifunctional protein-serine/threonine kinase/phosphatase, partial [Chthoniobacteraceae bacterium]